MNMPMIPALEVSTGQADLEQPIWLFQRYLARQIKQVATT